MYSKGISWIDDCRIPFVDEKVPRLNVAYEHKTNNNFGGGNDGRYGTSTMSQQNNQGRFPANILVSDDMLNDGVAREVARAVLPVNIYSSMFVTMNARSLMNFLSLRTTREGTKFPSFPQREIEMVAEMMENLWAEKMPVTYETFNKNGRVAP
jgi:flavin-dependent thymidylate synthase